MHLWNIDALAYELKTGKFTETQALRYYLLVALFQSVPFVLPVRSEGPLTFYSMGFGSVIPFVWLAAFVAGIILCFRANQQADGKDFIQRMICLEISSGFRALVFCIPLFFVGAFVRLAFPPEDSHTVVMWIMGVIILVMIIVQYWMIYRRLVASPQP